MMDLRSFISISLTCVLLATLNAAQDDQASNGQTRPKFISELYGDYVKTEERLWQRIQAAQFQTSDAIIADIVNSHRNLFFDDTFESNSYWRSYLIFGIENLREHLSNINDTLENNCRFLFDGAEKIVYNPMDIEQWTRDAMFRRLRDNRNGLFDLTVRRNDTILQHIQTVKVKPLNSIIAFNSLTKCVHFIAFFLSFSFSSSSSYSVCKRISNTKQPSIDQMNNKQMDECRKPKVVSDMLNMLYPKCN